MLNRTSTATQRRHWCAWLLAWAATQTALAQSGTPASPPVPVRQPLAALRWMLGDWQGEGWQYTRAGRKESVTQRERVEAKLGGSLIQFDGLGMQQRDTVHQALALLYVGPNGQELVFRPYTTDAKDSPASATINGSQLTWQLTTGDGMQVRYVIRPDDAGRWVETGEMSRNGGQSWQPFFGMTLTRKQRHSAADR